MPESQGRTFLKLEPLKALLLSADGFGKRSCFSASKTMPNCKVYSIIMDRYWSTLFGQCAIA